MKKYILIPITVLLLSCPFVQAQGLTKKYIGIGEESQQAIASDLPLQYGAKNSSF